LGATWNIDTAIASFKTSLKTEKPAAIVERDLLSGPVRAFGDESDKVSETLRRHLGSKLSVPEGSIYVVGSAKTGFSWAPDTFPTAFSKDSDIDVVIVDKNRFDKLWLALISVAYFQQWSKQMTTKRTLIDFTNSARM
jgi:hypothetical protein